MKPKLELKMGAEPAKVAILVALLALAGYIFYQNVWSTGDEVTTTTTPSRPASSPPTAGATSAAAVKPSMTPAPATAAPKQAGQAGVRGSREFRPSLKPKSVEERTRLQILDPTLRIDLLQKLAAVRMESADRSLFEFTASAPVAATAKPKLPEPKIVVQRRMIGPEPPPPPPPPPVKPPPPPIPLKFYGNLLPKKEGMKRVFCVQGEDILTPAEGELVQKRYRIVKINATSVVVEDVNFKHQQTIPIEEPAQGS